MYRHQHNYHNRNQTQQPACRNKQKMTEAARKARKAQKQLAKLFPHLACRLHKGVTAESIYQHAAALAKRHTATLIIHLKPTS